MISVHPSSAKAPPGKTFAHGYIARAASDVHELSWLILAYHWSPIVWQDGRRLQEHFVSSDWLALDFDSPEYTLDEAKRGFQGMTHLIGTTRSHRKEKGGVVCDRYRVVIPWSERITSLDLYRHNVAHALVLFEHADHACKDGARLYFPCTDIVQVEDDGEAWDVEPLPVAPKQKQSTKRPVRGYLSPTTRRWLTERIPQGTINNTIFRLGCALKRAGLTLEETLSAVEKTPTYQGINDSEGRRRALLAARNGHQRESQDEGK